MSNNIISTFSMLVVKRPCSTNVGNRTYHFSPVFESFKDYVATEQLDGDNKYDAGEHGLQVRLHIPFKV